MKKNWFDSKVEEFSSIGGYQKPQLNENSLKLDSNDYSFPTEVCLKIENKGIKMLDIPINHSFREEGRSSINLIFTSIKFLRFLMFLKYKFVKEK